MDDNAELRKDIDQLFGLIEVYERKNYFPVYKFRELKNEIVKKDHDRPILDKCQGNLSKLQAQLEKEKKQNANLHVNIRQLRKQLRDEEERYNYQLSALKEALDSERDHNLGLQGGIDALQQIAEQEK